MAEKGPYPDVSHSDPFQDVVRQEQVARLLRYIPSQYLGGILVVSLFIIFFSGTVANHLLLIWIGAILFLYVAGFVYMALLRNVPRSNILWTPFAYGYGIGGGLVWGLAAALFFDVERIETVLFLTPAIVGLTAIGVAGLVSYLPAVIAFLFSSLGPLVLMLLQARGHADIYVVLAMLVAICGVGFAVAASLSARQLLQASRLRYELGESESRFRGFAESASEWFWESDELDRITSISIGTISNGAQMVTELIGHTREEFAAEDRRLHPDQWRPYLEALAEHAPFRDFTYSFQATDGSRLTVSISGTPVFDSEGVFRGYRGTGKDITKERAAADKLKATQRTLLAAVEAYPGAFFLFDSEEKLVMFNSQALEWYTKIEPAILIGNTMENISRAFYDAYAAEIGIQEDADEWLRQRMERFRKTDEPFIQSLKEGQHTLVQEQRTNDGGTVSIRTDISDLVSAQRLAAQANRSKSEFLANMSHELRTPLNAIIGFADAIRHEVIGPLGNDAYKGYVEDIYQSGQHLLSLISDILDVSAVEAGRIILSESTINLRAVLDQCVALVRGRADEQELSLSIDVPTDLPDVYADERRIKQVLINLLNNAVKFTPDNGQIEVQALMTDDGALVVAVTDSGQGLTKDEIAVAMSPFGRTKEAIDSAQEGTGLGLPLSKSLMEAHGGSLEIVSGAEQGCTVRITLPASRVRPSA